MVAAAFARTPVPEVRVKALSFGTNAERRRRTTLESATWDSREG